MTVNHKDLTGVSLHESKGVAAASANTVYVANGSGSGTWEKVDKDAVKNNSEAMVEYTKAMAIGAGAKGIEAIASVLPDTFGCTTIESEASKFKGLSNTKVPPGNIGAFVIILEVVAAETSYNFKSACIVSSPTFDINTA